MVIIYHLVNLTTYIIIKSIRKKGSQFFFGGEQVTMAKFIIYKDTSGEYRWTLKAANGDTVADCSEGYSNKENVKGGINFVKTNAPGASVEDTTPSW